MSNYNIHSVIESFPSSNPGGNSTAYKGIAVTLAQLQALDGALKGGTVSGSDFEAASTQLALQVKNKWQVVYGSSGDAVGDPSKRTQGDPVLWEVASTDFYYAHPAVTSGGETSIAYVADTPSSGYDTVINIYIKTDGA